MSGGDAAGASRPAALPPEGDCTGAHIAATGWPGPSSYRYQ
jgi:hypothetical protein